MRLNLLFVVALCALSSVCPATAISRWFSSSYLDLRMTLRRYSHCVGSLSPLQERNLTDTEYLVKQIKSFLDQADYDNEQLANVTSLMDNICRSDLDSSYPISVNIDVAKYNNATGKQHRCRSIDDAMDSMFEVFRKSSLNKSEPLDFSVIQYYPNSTNKERLTDGASYNLTDLINTSWIKSETLLENVCKITDSVKDYVKNRMKREKAQDRSSQQSAQGGIFVTLMEFIDRVLDPFLGLQKRIFIEGNNRFEQAYLGISNSLGSLRNGLSTGLKNTRSRVVGLFSSSANSTATKSTEQYPQVSLPSRVNTTGTSSPSPFIGRSTTNPPSV